MKINAAKITRIALCTAFIAIGAMIAYPSKPAVTLQTLCIFLCSVILKPSEAFLSSLVYILLGIIGVPIFASFQGGPGVIMSLSGGFIISFPLIAFISSFLLNRFKSSYFVYAFVFTLSTICSYLFGAIWINIFALYNNPDKSLFNAIFVPFIIFDAIKIVITTICAMKLKKALNNDKKKNTNNKI